MKGNVPWVVVLRSCAERQNVDIDHKDCSAIADELVLRGKKIKEKDAALSGMKANNEKLSQEIAELKARLLNKDNDWIAAIQEVIDVNGEWVHSDELQTLKKQEPPYHTSARQRIDGNQR
jgi:N-acetyl-beta-hexosaminidase